MYRSRDCRNWERRTNTPSPPGRVWPFDQVRPECVCGDKRFLGLVFYWINVPVPGLPGSQGQRCVMQVAELFFVEGELQCDRNRSFELDLPAGETVDYTPPL